MCSVAQSRSAVRPPGHARSISGGRPRLTVSWRLTVWGCSMKLVALGDSITLGYGDPMPGGGWRGWAALLAEAVGADLHNLAKSGAQVRDVAESQLNRAVALEPDVASVVVGVNDTLRDTFDAARIARTLDHVIGVLRDRGALVLTAR